MALLAPYHDGMTLGAGFNSFMQELCLAGAVVREDGSSPAKLADIDPSAKPVPQSVTYKTSIIDKVSDFGKGSVEGSGDFLNVSKIKNADLTYMVSCKVVNQITTDQSLTKFSPVQGLKAADFPRVYGDSFISGFQEGGEFTAIISIRAKDRSQANTLKIDASVSLTLEKVNGSLDVAVDKIKRDILTENETTISVTWTGGGQDLKKPEEDWTFDTMRAVALKFPDRVAKCPMRTHAVLTKYSSLKSFHSSSTHFNPLSYENARVYTSTLRDAFLDYQNIAKGLAVLALDVNAGTQRLVTQQEKWDDDFAQKTLKASTPSLLDNVMSETQMDSLEKKLEAKSSKLSKESDTPAKAPPATISDAASEEAKDASDNRRETKESPKGDESKSIVNPSIAPTTNPLVIDKPYPPTMYGVESARMQCRFMMNRIVAEVDKVANHPEIAADESRPLPYMSPFLFNMLLPVGRAFFAA
ncbi:hypothetical protein LCI18_003934 [Fusarium solani-melongenae]|uniref:Uncharacterized protein n=1 Tax=Fusarium solani subsp. cucurbitae TaxID=2747967 RepID=A0ACD3YVJ8_FUSSC|nr:hypothetical protein LCI18_003934 [Fusarium solani-melongenae]